jgi:hypothetical protein
LLEHLAHETYPCEVPLRLAEAKGSAWYDLGAADGTLIRLDENGWRIVDPEDNPPVIFKRTDIMAAQCRPVRGGALEELWDFLPVHPQDRPLLLAWLVEAISFPDAEVPILWLSGEQGTGKSTISRRLVDILGPTPAPLEGPPRTEKDWVMTLCSSKTVALDNVSTISPWFSDALCKAVTGTGFKFRKLYTNAGIQAFAFKRIIILNAIDTGPIRGDLEDRLVPLRLRRIAPGAYLPGRELDAQWSERKPFILGAVWDLAVEVRGAPAPADPHRGRMAEFWDVLTRIDALLETRNLSSWLRQGVLVFRVWPPVWVG